MSRTALRAQGTGAEVAQRPQWMARCAGGACALLVSLCLSLVPGKVSAESVPAEVDGYWLTTAYCHTGSRTASGTWPRYGSVAAPRGIAFGTVLEIESYGVGVVEDRGGAIVGRRLDLWMSCPDAVAWGVRWVRVAQLEHDA